MEDYYLMICKTCKETTWTAEHKVTEYIKAHQGHDFTLITPFTRHNEAYFRQWLHEFMGWPREAEERDG